VREPKFLTLNEVLYLHDGSLRRTGTAAAFAFLMLNGVDPPVDDGSIYDALIAIAEKRLDKSGLADLLEKFCGQK
jgi:prophage maintenance system killer protein